MYYSTQFNTAQLWSTDILRYTQFLVSGRKMAKQRSSSPLLSAIKLCIVIDVLNNKTIILLNLAKYRLILANSAYGLVG